MRTGSLRPREEGFTLIELLVVMLIISILSAIALPVFLVQRNKAREADVRSSLKNAATAAETYGTDNNGDFSDLNGDDGTLLAGRGFTLSPNVSVLISAEDGLFCVTASHAHLPGDHPWAVGTYNSTDGFPSPKDSDDC